MNKIDLSIIIAHYCTGQSTLHYNSFIRKLNTIKEQCDNYKIEEDYAREVYNSQRLN